MPQGGCGNGARRLLRGDRGLFGGKMRWLRSFVGLFGMIRHFFLEIVGGDG